MELSEIENIAWMAQGLGTSRSTDMATKGGKWYPENRSPISESRQRFYRVLEAPFFLFGSEIARVSGSDFQTRVSVSWRVSDFTIRHPSYWRRVIIL